MIIDSKSFVHDDEQRLLLDFGAHIGHTWKSLEPRMKGYIYGFRDQRAIFDLKYTKAGLARAARFIKHAIDFNCKIYVLATKPDVARVVQPLIPNHPLIHFSTSRWLGGTLTNWNVMHRFAQEQCQEAWKDLGQIAFIEAKMEGKSFQRVMLQKLISKTNEKMSRARSKKFFRSFQHVIEYNMWNKIIGYSKGTSHARLFEGININPKEPPHIILTFNLKYNETMANEAWVIGTPVVAICDSDVDIRPVSYVIPGNDDSLKAQYLYARTLFNNIPNIEI